MHKHLWWWHLQLFAVLQLLGDKLNIFLTFSLLFSDTICDLGGAKELANYGEYSGAPSEQQTYEYAKTILSLMTAEIHPDGKILIVGGGIANFTNVAATFKVCLNWNTK